MPLPAPGTSTLRKQKYHPLMGGEPYEPAEQSGS